MTTVLLKIGGRTASDEKTSGLLFKEMARLRDRFDFILVHGGGAEVSRISSHFGFQPRFVDGIRMTSPEEMDIVDMVLAGKINKHLVRKLNLETRAVGISGSDGMLFTGEAIQTGGGPNRTGRITGVRTELLSCLLDRGFIPVVATTSMDTKGSALNINADEAALHLAVILEVDHLIYLSDIPGIDGGNGVLRHIDEHAAETSILEGVISGGMIPKVRSSLDALHKGVGQVIIGQFSSKGDLERLIQGIIGTSISLMEETV